MGFSSKPSLSNKFVLLIDNNNMCDLPRYCQRQITGGLGSSTTDMSESFVAGQDMKCSWCRSVLDPGSPHCPHCNRPGTTVSHSSGQHGASNQGSGSTQVRDPNVVNINGQQSVIYLR